MGAVRILKPVMIGSLQNAVAVVAVEALQIVPGAPPQTSVLVPEERIKVMAPVGVWLRWEHVV